MKTLVSYFENFAFRYFNFWDRATRAEYWYVMPVIWGLIILALIWDIQEVWQLLLARQVPPLTPLYYESIVLFGLTFIPRISLTVRRLHDCGRSGKWAALPFMATQSSFFLIIGIGSAMITTNMSGFSQAGGVAGLAMIALLFSGQVDAFWQGMFSIAAMINAIGWEAIWAAISTTFQGAQPPETGVVIRDLGREIQQVPNQDGLIELVTMAMMAMPFITISLHLYFMLSASERDFNSYGDSTVAPITGGVPIKPKHDVMQGYACLMQRSPAEEAALKMRQKEEVKALYQQRVLGRTSEVQTP